MPGTHLQAEFAPVPCLLLCANHHTVTPQEMDTAVAVLQDETGLVHLAAPELPTSHSVLYG